ncbi:phosphoribosyltransferase [Streptomyces umbrinus]|uniref:phosphoribosyltransferase n=1 Tax=Streptomyces umbrinus TaxID=67370 RepID=UPI0033FCC97D
MRYIDRVDAGRQLADSLGHLAGLRPVVLGIPRGGVIVAFQVARALEVPLDFVVVRPLVLPSPPEAAFGAITEDGVRLTDPALRYAADVPAVQAAEVAALQGQVHHYRAGRPPTCLSGRTVIVVDDGITTGYTALAAYRAAQLRGAARTVLAVPVGPARTVAELRGYTDEVICPRTPPVLGSLSDWYTDFAPPHTGEVAGLLDRATRLAVHQG